MNHRCPAFLAGLVSSVLLLVASPALVRAADVRELERQYYELDYKMRQWVKLQEANKQIIVPPGFQEDLERYNQLAAQLGVARAEQAAEIAAEDEARQSLIGMIATRDTVDKAVELADAKIEDLNKESEFYEEWYKNWLEEAKTDTGVAITANDAASPELRKKLKLQEMKDECVRRQREIGNQIEALENRKRAMQVGMTGVKTLLGASDIKDAIGEGDFFEAADKTIEVGSGIAEVAYDEKKFKEVSERLEAGKSGLGAAKKLWEGDYLDGSIDAVDTIDSLIEDVSKDHGKESRTLQLFMESDFTDPALKKQALQVIDIANTRKIDLEKVMAMKNKVQGVGNVLKQFQRMQGWYNTVMGEIQGYKQLAAEPGRSGTTARLIAGMSKLGMIFKEGAGYLPPGLNETIGQFLEFYGDALQLGDEIDKKIRDYFEKRGDCLNVVGGLQNTFCVEEIEKMGGRGELCLNYAPEFRAVRLPMFVDIGLGKAPPQPRYFYIPDTSRAPTPLTDAQYTALIKIASDYGAYCTILAEDYQLTAEDLGSIVDAVVNSKPEFTINNGVISDSTFTIKDLAEDVRVLLHVKEAIGDQLTPDNARDMIKAWLAFESDLSFAERACGFTICDHERERNRLFVTYLESRDSYNNFIERQKLTQPDSRCRATVQIKGPDIVAQGEAVTYEAVPNDSLKEAKEVKYAWRELPGGKEIGTGPGVTHAFGAKGAFGIQLKASGQAGGSPMDLAKAELKVEVQEPGAGDYVFEIEGPEAVPVGQPAVLKSSLRGLNRRGRELLENSRVRWYVGENAVGVGEYCTVDGRPAGTYTVTARMLTETNGKFVVTDSRQHTVTVSDDAGRAQVGVTISGPTVVKAGADIRLSATISAKDALSKQLADRGVVLWAVGDTVLERGNTMWSDAGAPGDYEVTASVVVDFNGRESVLARATHRWKVTADGKEEAPAGESTEPSEPVTGKPEPGTAPGGATAGARPGKYLSNLRWSPVPASTHCQTLFSVDAKNPPKMARYCWYIDKEPKGMIGSDMMTEEPQMLYQIKKAGRLRIGVKLFNLDDPDTILNDQGWDTLVGDIEVTDAPLKINAPAQVNAGDHFNASIPLPADMVSRIGEYQWYMVEMRPDSDNGVVSGGGNLWPRTSSPSIALQADPVHAGLKIKVRATLYEKGGQGMGSAESGLIEIKKPDLAVSAPSGWTREDKGTSISFSRDTVDRRFPQREGGPPEGGAHVTAYVGVNMMNWSKPQAFEGTPVANGKYKGAIKHDKPVKDGTYEYYSVAGGMQYDETVVSFSGHVDGRADSWSDDAKSFCLAECERADKEMMDIIKSVKVTPREQYTNTQQKLEVKLEAGKTTLDYGETATIRALATGGTLPYEYQWSGNHAKGIDPSVVEFAASKPGEHVVSVMVKDASNETASASITLKLAAYSATIQMSGGAEKIVLGETRNFAATVKFGEKDVTGNVEYQWQPHPEVEFDPYEGTSPRTTAKFTKPGPVKVWAQVLEKKEGRLVTMAESDPIELEVVEPGLKLVADPMEPMIGQTVRALVSTEGGIDDANIAYWWEIKGNVLNAGPLADEREYSFVVKDMAPVTLIVHAKAKDGGDDLGEAEVSVKAKQFDVKIGEPRLMGPPPQVWDPKKGGLVEVPRAIGVNRDFSVKVSVNPPPADASALRYQWMVSPEGCVIMSPASQETRCNARAAGSYSLQVVVRNAEGGELGVGTREVRVVASDDPAKVNNAAAKLAEAKQLYQQDKLDEAITAAQAAAAMHPNNPEPSQLASKWAGERQAVMQQVTKAQTMANGKRFDDAFTALGEAKKLHAKYPPVIQAETLIKHLKAKADETKKQAQQPTNTASALKNAFINSTSAPAGSLWGTSPQTSGTKPTTPATPAKTTKPQTPATTQVKPQTPAKAPTVATQAKPPAPAPAKPKPPPPQTAKPAAPAGPPRLAGSAWSGTLTLQGAEGPMNAPISFSIDGGNGVSGSARFEDPEDGEGGTLPLSGRYDPSSGSVSMGFSQKDEYVSVSGTLNGSAKSGTLIQGNATMRVTGFDEPTSVNGSWKATRTR